MSLSISMDENDSTLLKSRRPRKTLTLDRQYTWSNFRCPLRKGIIYYSRNEEIFEHDLYSSSKEPRMIITFARSAQATKFELIPINCNKILLIAMSVDDYHILHLSIHEIHAYCVGPALWTYHGYTGYLNHNVNQLQPMKSTTNTLGITFGVDSQRHMKLFDISADAKNDSYPLVESGRLNYGRQLDHPVVLSPDRRILLSADENNETIDVFYSGTGDTDNMDFSFVTHVSIPNPNGTNHNRAKLGVPSLAFSADGTKFAAGTANVVSVWDVRSKLPLKVFEVDVPKEVQVHYIQFLQFSSGIFGREVLAFIVANEDFFSTGLKTIHMIDATSFETQLQETLCLPATNNFKEALFFEPSGGSMYAVLGKTLYEWDLRKNPGPKWWLGDE